MHAPYKSHGTRSGDPGDTVARALTDELLARYIDWRNDTAAVTDAYSRWADAPPGENGVRFAAYTAALDQEQCAAEDYLTSARELDRWLSTNR